MKPPQFFITLILSAFCLLFSIIVVWESSSFNKSLAKFQDDQGKLQARIQTDQGEINRGNQLSQVLSTMVSEVLAAKDEKLTGILNKDGIKINVPSPSPGASPAASAPVSSETSTPR